MRHPNLLLLSVLACLCRRSVAAPSPSPTSSEEASIHAIQREQRVLTYRIDQLTRQIAAASRRAELREAGARAQATAIYKLTRGGSARRVCESGDDATDLVNVASLRRILAREVFELRAHREAIGRLRRTRTALQVQLDRQISRLQSLRAAGASRSRALQRHAPERLPWQPGSLPWPAAGCSPSGQRSTTKPLGRLGAVRRGLTLSCTRPAEPVRAVEAGVVRFSADLPAYGRVVILEHEGGYLSVYGFLAAATVEPAEEVTMGAIIGRAGRDPLDERPSLYFELREGVHLLEARRWLRAKR